MSAANPRDRVLIARIAIAERWGREPDRVQATSAARSAFLDRFEREADPDGVLSPGERQRRAASLRSAHMQRLALRSAQARRARAGGAA